MRILKREVHSRNALNAMRPQEFPDGHGVHPVFTTTKLQGE